MLKLLLNTVLNSKTWVLEHIIVACISIIVWLFTGANWIELIGCFAVQAAFGHAAITDRLTEREHLKEKPDVYCYAWSTRYFFCKELLWLMYFVINGSWSAVVGVFVFLIYPFWRKIYRKHRPINRGIFTV